jgi:hypothetical protein
MYPRLGLGVVPGSQRAQLKIRIGYGVPSVIYTSPDSETKNYPLFDADRQLESGYFRPESTNSGD